MWRARVVACASVLALWSCGNQAASDASAAAPGSATSATSAGSDSDPWSGKPKADKQAAGSDEAKAKAVDDSASAFDLKASLEKIADNLAKPGPYEPPDQSDDFDPAKPHWGVLRLHGAIVERQAMSWTGGDGLELRALTERLRGLVTDATLTGVIVRLDGLEVSLPDAVELRAAMHDFRKAGKRLVCHAENAHNADYLVLAACERVGLAPLGDVVISGPVALPIHIKALLDKLGIEPDFLHIGAYKGAAEPLTLEAPSKESTETLGAILDRRYQTMVDAIAGERKLAPGTAQQLIDTALFPSDHARSAGLVDDVLPFEAFRDAARGGQPWIKLDLEPDQHDRLAMLFKLWRFLGAMPPERPAGGHVALVYALGTIVDGGGDGVLGARAQIAAHTLVPALHALAVDDSVKAVVLRIDSGGGSAQASELIWRAVADLVAKKPVIVSMSDVAASGGYYIACGATRIYALDDTLTGSIGVVGGKLALANALKQLGVNTFPVGRGKRATMNASLGTWSDDERAAIKAAMESVYKVFVARVAGGRHAKPDDILKIAEGRVWTGSKAKELGLVDDIGGLDAALADARKRGKVDADTPLEVYPPAPSLRDFLVSFGQVQAPFGLSASAGGAGGAEVFSQAAALLTALRAIDPRVADATEHLVRLVISFRSSTVQAVAILPVLP